MMFFHQTCWSAYRYFWLESLSRISWISFMPSTTEIKNTYSQPILFLCGTTHPKESYLLYLITLFFCKVNKNLLDDIFSIISESKTIIHTVRGVWEDSTCAVWKSPTKISIRTSQLLCKIMSHEHAQWTTQRAFPYISINESI